MRREQPMFLRWDIAVPALMLLFALGAPVLFWDGAPCGTKPYESARACIRELIRVEGPLKAREEIARTHALESQGTQHLAMHLFGEALWEAVGSPGAAICDHRFGSGCAHGFFGLALAGGGHAYLPSFVTACINESSAPAGCLHGLGHGIVASMGRERLAAALEMCRSLPVLPARFGGCLTGAFMEYNIGTTEGVREFSAHSPHAPCTSAPVDMQPSCYLFQPLWWMKIFPPTEELLARLGDLCRAVPDEDPRDACFMGIGYALIPEEGFDPYRSMATCGSLPNKAEVAACRAGALVGAWPRVRDDAGVRGVCKEGLPPEHSWRCGMTLLDTTSGGWNIPWVKVADHP